MHKTIMRYTLITKFVILKTFLQIYNILCYNKLNILKAYFTIDGLFFSPILLLMHIHTQIYILQHKYILIQHNYILIQLHQIII